MTLSGTVVPMATPIDGNGQKIDTETLERFTSMLVENGVHGLFPGSSIGEFSSLGVDEHETVIQTVTSAARTDTRVLAGCCGTSIREVRTKLEAAASAGADAAVVVTPYYLETTQEGLCRFFFELADESPLPLLLYNIPGLTGNEITAETVARLAEHDAIVGLKDTSGDLIYLHDVLVSTPDSFSVFNGMTATAVASLDLGLDGIIAGPANVFPAELVELYEAHRRGDQRTVSRISSNVVMPLVSTYQDMPTAAAIKHLVDLNGLDIGGPLPPLAPLSPEQGQQLRECYNQVTDAVNTATR